MLTQKGFLLPRYFSTLQSLIYNVKLSVVDRQQIKKTEKTTRSRMPRQEEKNGYSQFNKVYSALWFFPCCVMSLSLWHFQRKPAWKRIFFQHGRSSSVFSSSLFLSVGVFIFMDRIISNESVPNPWERRADFFDTYIARGCLNSCRRKTQTDWPPRCIK